MEHILLSWLRVSRNRPFLLIIAGRISGIHDEKGTHIPIACQMDGPTLLIEFEESERLTVSQAVDVSIRSSGELVVRDASEARFSWFSHAGPRTDPGLCEEVFRKSGRLFWFGRTGAAFVTNGNLVYSGNQFVLLRPA